MYLHVVCFLLLFKFFFSEKTVEHFSLFLQTMEENLTRMKAKFIDHCNKMSGREQCTYCQYCAIIACILTLNKFSKKVLKIIIKLLAEIIIINAIINNQIHFNNTPQCQNAKYNNAQCVLQSNYVLIFPLFFQLLWPSITKWRQWLLDQATALNQRIKNVSTLCVHTHTLARTVHAP